MWKKVLLFNLKYYHFIEMSLTAKIILMVSADSLFAFHFKVFCIEDVKIFARALLTK